MGQWGAQVNLSTLWSLLPHGWDIVVKCCLCSLSWSLGVTCPSLQIPKGPVSAAAPSRSRFMHPGTSCLLLLQVLCNIPPEPFLQGCHKIRRFPISGGYLCPLSSTMQQAPHLFRDRAPWGPRTFPEGGSSDFCISSGVGGGTGRPFRNTSAIKKNTEIKTEELQQTHAISWVCGGRGGQVGGGHGCVRRGHGWRGVRGDTGGCEGDTGV